MNNTFDLKKFLNALTLIVTLIGCFGGAGYLFMVHQPFLAVFAILAGIANTVYAIKRFTDAGSK